MSDDIEENDKDKNQPQPDMAQAEQILFYQDAPIGGSSSFQEAVQSRANFAQRIPGTSEWTIGNGVGSLSQLTREEIAQKQKEDSDEWFEEFAETVDHLREEEREREQWAQEKHKYAGIEMTGEEWGEFADQLKGDTPLRKWLLEKLKKEGKTDAKATEMVDQMALLAKMQSLPKNQWTDEMKALDTKLEADPKLRAELDKNIRDAKKLEADFKADGATVEQHADIGRERHTDCFRFEAGALLEGEPEREWGRAFVRHLAPSYAILRLRTVAGRLSHGALPSFRSLVFCAFRPRLECWRTSFHSISISGNLVGICSPQVRHNPVLSHPFQITKAQPFCGFQRDSHPRLFLPVHR